MQGHSKHLSLNYCVLGQVMVIFMPKATEMMYTLTSRLGLKYPPTNFWGVVLFLLPTLLCSLSITGGRSKVGMLLASAMDLDSVGTSP